MCGAISTPCQTQNCNNFTRYESICETCKNNQNYPTGV